MRDAIKPFKWAALVLLVIAGASLAAQAQQSAAAGARNLNSMATPLLGNDVPVNQRRVGVLQSKIPGIRRRGCWARAGRLPRVLHVCDGAVE